QPTDFGEYKSIFYSGPKPKTVTISDKEYLRKLCYKFKKGEIDSLKLEKKLEQFLAPDEEKLSSR
ncbi:MAG: hypothetical protein ACXVP4_15010, partial [Bacteroidia bacterium]